MEAGGGEKTPALPTALPVEERAQTAQATVAATRAPATAAATRAPATAAAIHAVPAPAAAAGNDYDDEFDGEEQLNAEIEEVMRLAEEEYAARGAAAAEKAATEKREREHAEEIDRLIAAQEEIVQSTKRGKQGRLSKKEKVKRQKAEAEIEQLRRGLLPSERKQQRSKPSDDEVLDSAATADNAAHVAGPTVIRPAGRFGGGKVSQASGEDSSPAGAEGSSQVGPAGAEGGSQAGASGGRQPSSPPPPGEDSDDEGDADGDKDEEANASNYYAIPKAQRGFIAKVIDLCKRGALESAQSPVFSPPDPMKGSECYELDSFLLSPVYVHAWHKYFASCGLPEQPPCPTHGFRAVEQRKVFGRGWAKGRRVSGVFKDTFMIGTKHECSLCRAEKEELKKRAEEWRGERRNGRVMLQHPRSEAAAPSGGEPRAATVVRTGVGAPALQARTVTRPLGTGATAAGSGAAAVALPPTVTPHQEGGVVVGAVEVAPIVRGNGKKTSAEYKAASRALKKARKK